MNKIEERYREMVIKRVISRYKADKKKTKSILRDLKSESISISKKELQAYLK